ncbi:hypothetical protein [Planomicrobium okeanokoites]|uniref:Uncharacterized protein n=1 Tax=Planomicrobium okeanokoites TaxID=244 RepID=A0ABV7KL98_PLAOK|nr:hypothetical protein [Planomicrobium okeanokoites]TAA69340.1 hypothetical protein D2910_08355 [Planomicrobium okeanokoites]
MAERVDMSFKNKEVKMWFMIMLPVFILGTIALFTSEPTSRYLPFLIMMIGLAIYYSWRFRYRKKKKESDTEK